MVIGAGCFLVLVAVYLVLVGPFFSSKAELDEKLDSSYRLLQEYKSILSDETAYQKGLQERRGDMLAVSRLLLSGNTSSLAAAELSNKIRGYADVAGVSITRENVNQPVVIDDHQRISIQLNMSCDIAGLHDFLMKMEEDSNLLFVQNLEVNAPSSMRRSYRKGRFSERNRPESNDLRITATISGFIEGNELSDGGGQ